MKTATVGEIQKNFAKILREINSGEMILITRHGRPVAKLTAVAPRSRIEWPDFFEEALELKGKPLSEILSEEREGRF